MTVAVKAQYELKGRSAATLKLSSESCDTIFVLGIIDCAVPY